MIKILYKQAKKMADNIKMVAKINVSLKGFIVDCFYALNRTVWAC